MVVIETKCEICEHPQRSVIEQELLEGLPRSMLADELGIEVSVISTHMDEHFSEGFNEIVNVPDSRILLGAGHIRGSYEKFNVLEINKNKLVDRFDALLERDELSKEDTDQIVNMAREIRQTAMVMSQLESEIRNELELTRGQFEALKAAVLMAFTQIKLVPEDREKVFRIIDAEFTEVDGAPGGVVSVGGD